MNRLVSRVVLSLLLSLASAYCAAGVVIHVPGDQPTIQAGIDAASNGDTVLVSAGIYYENVNFNGKAITVTSASGPSTTKITNPASNSSATITFQSG